MAETAIIIDVVSRGTRLSLELYEFGSTASAVTQDSNRIAKRLGELSLTLKQVGASFREDDTVPSPEALETIQEIVQQCQSVFSEIEELIPLHQLRDRVNGAFGSPTALRTWQWQAASKERMEYLLGHLESLKLTLLVMLQAFYAVRVMRWSKQQSTYTPLRARETVRTEKLQLQALVIEQQMALLRSSELHSEYEHSKAVTSGLQKLLTGGDFQEPVELEGSPVVPSPSALVKYQETSLAHLGNPSTDAECLSMVRGISLAYIDDVIGRWTRLREIEERSRLVEQEMQAQKAEEQWDRRQKQQPTVESDSSDDELMALPGLKRHVPNIATPAPRRAPTFHRTYSDTEAIPIPVPPRNGYQATPPTPTSPQHPLKASPNRTLPISPASSVKSSPYSPRSSFDATSMPRAVATAAVAAAAAATDRADPDDNTGLEIPWKLTTRNNYWHHIDRKVVKTNTEAPPSQALSDRSAQTEILASWVCKEAIEEAEYAFSQVQKERSYGKKTRFEKCFVIQRGLTFVEVERLVERTIEILNQNLNSQNGGPKRNQPPPLDRSYSSPAAPTQRGQPFMSPSAPQGPYSPGFAPYPQQQQHQLPPPPPIPPQQQQPQLQPQHHQYSRSFSPTYNPQQPPFSPTMPMYAGYQTYLDPSSAKRSRQPSSRPSSSGTYGAGPGGGRGNYSTPSTSDTDDMARKEKERKRREREKRRANEKTDISGRAALGTLAKVGGLAALLDGFAEAAVGI